MTEEKQEQRMELTLLEQKPRVATDIISRYVGKQIVMEIEGSLMSSGKLNEYDGRFVEVTDYKEHRFNLRMVLDEEYNRPEYDLTSSASVIRSLPQKVINVNQINSIVSLDDILEARKSQ